MLLGCRAAFADENTIVSGWDWISRYATDPLSFVPCKSLSHLVGKMSGCFLKIIHSLGIYHLNVVHGRSNPVIRSCFERCFVRTGTNGETKGFLKGKGSRNTSKANSESAGQRRTGEAPTHGKTLSGRRVENTLVVWGSVV